MARFRTRYIIRDSSEYAFSKIFRSSLTTNIQLSSLYQATTIIHGGTTMIKKTVKSDDEWLATGMTIREFI